MFRVEVDSLADYLNFDLQRKPDLEKLHALLVKAAPNLKRYFHKGTPAGEPGMRMKLIGYGKYRYDVKGKPMSWAVIAVALQKNYISVYTSIAKDGKPIVLSYKGELGELRMGGNNFSFEKFDDLNVRQVAALFAEIAAIFKADPQNPVRYRQGS